MSKPILVTGANGYVAKHLILKLLARGYPVRGTLRDLKRGAELRATLAQNNAATDGLEFVQADLVKDDGWTDAVRECDYVLHAASPFPLHPPQDENELIVPAREGTLRVLRAANVAGVKRVVVLSSMAAVDAGHAGENRTFDENDWSNLDKDIGAYPKSKTLAERAAWDYIHSAENTKQVELATINASFINGPFLDTQYATSGEMVSTLLKHQVPGVGHIKYAIVDVRDVAEAMILAALTPNAADKRFCCVGQMVWMQEIAVVLQKHFAARGYNVPTRVLPNFLIRTIALFDPKVRIVAPLLDWDYSVSTERIRTVLNWKPLPAEQTFVEMGESMIRLGLV